MFLGRAVFVLGLVSLSTFAACDNDKDEDKGGPSLDSALLDKSLKSLTSAEATQVCATLVDGLNPVTLNDNYRVIGCFDEAHSAELSVEACTATVEDCLSNSQVVTEFEIDCTEFAQHFQENDCATKVGDFLDCAKWQAVHLEKAAKTMTCDGLEQQFEALYDLTKPQGSLRAACADIEESCRPLF